MAKMSTWAMQQREEDALREAQAFARAESEYLTNRKPTSQRDIKTKRHADHSTRGKEPNV